MTSQRWARLEIMVRGQPGEFGLMDGIEWQVVLRRGEDCDLRLTMPAARGAPPAGKAMRQAVAPATLIGDVSSADKRQHWFSVVKA